MLTLPIIAGTLASMAHVISGPDHLAAVTPLAIETDKKAWKIGFYWGFGHLLGMLLIGMLFLLFKAYIPVEAISAISEQLVAFVLIGVGFWSFYQIFYKKNTPHLHTSKEKSGSVWSSLSIGILHGFAGVAHFIFLLPVLGFENYFESVQYITGFAIGTVFAMTAYTYILEKTTANTKYLNNPKAFKAIRFAGGLFAIIIGFYWLYLSL